MKHHTNRFSAVKLATLVLLCCICHVGFLFGQVEVEFIPHDCNVEFKSTVDFSEYQGSVPEVTSVGIFYRLDNIDDDPTASPNIGSYFWSAIITKDKPSINDILPIPPGNYTTTFYVTRKGGPIKTGYVSYSNNKVLPVGYNNCPQPPTEMPPSVDYFSNDREKLAFSLLPSWQVGTDPQYYSPVAKHETENPDVETPQIPWLFLTLVARDWNINDQDIEIMYDKVALKYAGAIADNSYGEEKGTWQYIESVSINNDGNVVVTPKARPDNGQSIIHLIFEQNDKSLDTLEQIEFIAIKRSPGGAVSQQSETRVEVKGAPHDPNNLKVDKDTLCPCQVNEWLTYEVRFQNLGSATAEDVHVKFLDYQGLVLSTLNMPADRTMKRSKQILYDTLNATFIIEDINLPGFKQKNIDEDETWEKFKFTIKKEDCLAAGDLIQPRVGIVFIGDHAQDTIYTNLEATYIADKIKRRCFCIKSYCPTPDASCKGCKRKKRWLLDCLCRILHWRRHYHHH